MTGRVRRMTARELEHLPREHGFTLVGRSGSDAKWRHPALRLQVIVPEHAGRVLPVGTLVAVLTAAGIARDEWTD